MECIKIFADEIEGRIDPFYYKREFRELDNKLKSPIFREFKENILNNIKKNVLFYGILFR